MKRKQELTPATKGSGRQRELSFSDSSAVVEAVKIRLNIDDGDKLKTKRLNDLVEGHQRICNSDTCVIFTNDETSQVRNMAAWAKKRMNGKDDESCPHSMTTVLQKALKRLKEWFETSELAKDGLEAWFETSPEHKIRYATAKCRLVELTMNLSISSLTEQDLVIAAVEIVIAEGGAMIQEKQASTMKDAISFFSSASPCAQLCMFCLDENHDPRQFNRVHQMLCVWLVNNELIREVRERRCEYKLLHFAMKMCNTEVADDVQVDEWFRALV